jgi:hypothetical protein
MTQEELKENFPNTWERFRKRKINDGHAPFYRQLLNYLDLKDFMIKFIHIEDSDENVVAYHPFFYIRQEEKHPWSIEDVQYKTIEEAQRKSLPSLVSIYERELTGEWQRS